MYVVRWNYALIGRGLARAEVSLANYASRSALL